MLTSVVPLAFLLSQPIDPGSAELQKALQQDAATSAANAASAPASAEPVGAQAGVQRPGSSLLNPAMSVILDATFGYYGKSRFDFGRLFLPLAGDDPAGPPVLGSTMAPGREGFGVQEVELAASAAIDPYLEGALFLTVPNLQGIEVEEGYLVTTALPANLQFKAGTFRSQVGRNNTQHLHLQNFTRRPLMTALLFGVDGLRGPGAQASVLLPLPWFATFYAEAFSLAPPDDPAIVGTFGGGDRATPRNLTYTAVLEQYWDLGENTSLLLGLNFATGHLFDCVTANVCDPAVVAAPRTMLYGGDLYFKWKPANVAQTYASFQWTTEFFERAIANGPTEGAGYTEPVVQIARRWYLGARVDVTGLPSGAGLFRRYGYASSLTFAPSEFSRFRVFAQELTGAGVPSSTVGFLQAEFSMGAHGAHPF
ncbi:MAG: TonB-dependent receptor [Myxococcales bacterium]|nr:TonB-dependent receptor [Myxococcales bacterium]